MTGSSRRTLSTSKIAAALRRGRRQRRIEVRAGEIQASLRSEQLVVAPAVSTAMGASVTASVAVISTMLAAIAGLAAELEADFEQHPGQIAIALDISAGR